MSPLHFRVFLWPLNILIWSLSLGGTNNHYSSFSESWFRVTTPWRNSVSSCGSRLILLSCSGYNQTPPPKLKVQCCGIGVFLNNWADLLDLDPDLACHCSRSLPAPLTSGYSFYLLAYYSNAAGLLVSCRTNEPLPQCRCYVHAASMEYKTIMSHTTHYCLTQWYAKSRNGLSVSSTVEQNVLSI